MTDWSKLSQAHGPADDIPALLDQAGADPNSTAWSELWSRLCHQGGTCSASYAALPDLIDVARRRSGKDRAEPLVPAGAILASTDWPADIDQPLDRHADHATTLRQLTTGHARASVAALAQRPVEARNLTHRPQR